MISEKTAASPLTHNAIPIGAALNVRPFYVSIIIVDVLILGANLLINQDINQMTVSFGGLLEYQLALSKEANFATWYSSFLFCLVGVMAILHAGSGSKHRLESLGWLGMGLGLVFLSIEEVAQIHEMVGIIYSKQYGSNQSLSDPVFAWIYLYIIPIIGFVALACMCFIASFRFHRVPLVTSFLGLACWVAVIAFEYIESQNYLPSMTRSVYHLVLEEGFELAGATCLIIAFIEHQKIKFSMTNKRE